MTRHIYACDFGSFDNRVWINCAHQGPLPLVAVEAAEEALKWKIKPYHLDDESFIKIPRQGPGCSTLVLFSHKKANRNDFIYETLRQKKIDISLREGNLRISPHLYNTTNDIDRLLSILGSVD